MSLGSVATTQTGVITGIVLMRGFGFLQLPDGRRVFLHSTALRGGLTLDQLSPGDRLTFEMIETDKGLRAVRATRAPEAS